MIKIIINGSTGKMGQLALKHIQKSTLLVLVATPARHDNLSAVIKDTRADVVLDLTNADCVYENTKTIIEANCSPVIGTSGLTAAKIDELQQLAKKHNVGGIIVPNFSIGAVLMMQFSQIAARHFNDLHIIETHHLDKKDKPSGTARRTAELMAAEKNIAYNEIFIESKRTADAVAAQDVIFKTPYESLTISHNSTSRESFMPGLVLACEKAANLNDLVVGLEHLFK